MHLNKHIRLGALGSAATAALLTALVTALGAGASIPPPGSAVQSSIPTPPPTGTVLPRHVALPSGYAACGPQVLTNTDFETPDPTSGPFSTFSPTAAGPGPSAAAGWETFINSPQVTYSDGSIHQGTMASDILDIPHPGAPGNVLHQITNDLSGSFGQFHPPYNSGPTYEEFSVWVYLNAAMSGQGVTVGAGIGNEGNTSFTAGTTTTGRWVQLTGYNSVPGQTPANNFVVGAENLNSPLNGLNPGQGGVADFYVADPQVRALCSTSLGSIPPAS